MTFPPPYEPHGIKLLYDGKPVDLSPEEEEVRRARANTMSPGLPTDDPPRRR